MSKIGKSTMIAVVCMLAVAMITVITLLCIVFSNAMTDNVMESAKIASSVLEHDIDSRCSETEMLAQLFSQDEKCIEAVETGDKAAVLAQWESVSKAEGIFALFINSDGIIAYQTDNCLLSSQGVFDAIAAGKSGLTTDSEISLWYRSVEKNQGITVIVGYNYGDTAVVDGVREQTESQATIFADNLRISTTFLNKDGSRAIGTTMKDEIYEKVVGGGELYQQQTELFGDDYMATYTPIIDEYGVIKGAYFTGCPMANVISNRNKAILTGIIAGVIIILLSAVCVLVFIQYQVVIPVNTVKEMARQMEQGNLSNNTGVQRRLSDNEIGDVAKLISLAVSTLNVYVSDISAMMKEMSGGNFAYRSDIQYKGDFAPIAESAKALNNRMRNVIDGINASADEVYSGSQMISTGSNNLAQGSTRQASAAEELSSSVAEITENIKRNADNTEKAQQLSDDSISMVNSQNEQIENMLAAMTDIEDSAAQISKIIKTIEDIAFQTNILALNAAVEAARAGAAGKGFAVVADEVRNLANKSAEAANNTSVLIGSCIEAVNNGSKIAHSTAEAMTKVVEITGETNTLIGNIAQQTSKQSESVQQIKSEIDNISEVISQNSATAQESAASSEELNGQAAILREKISIFQV